MNDALMKTWPQESTGQSRMTTMLSAAILLSFPLLVIFPRPAGWLAGVMAIAGMFALVRHRNMHAMDWRFLAICLILPVSHLWNMLIMGWEPGFLERPAHLLWGFMIYFLIGKYGLPRKTLFYAACMAAFISLGIALYEALYLGNERVFGLGQRWNAVPFGNFAMLFAFFCLAGAFIARQDGHRSRFQAWLGMAGFVCGLVASVLSGTRGGLLALPFLFLLCISFNASLGRRKRWLMLAVSTLVMTLVVFGSDRMQDRLLLAKEQVIVFANAPEAPQSREGSVGIRLGMWYWGVKKFLEHPYTGIGIASYGQEREQAVQAGELPAEFDRLANLHNELITSLAFGGLPSAAALLAFWILGWRFFYTKIRSADNDGYYFALCGLITVLGTAVFSMTEGLFGTSPGTKAIMLCLAIPAGALRYRCINGSQVAMPASYSIAKV